MALGGRSSWIAILVLVPGIAVAYLYAVDFRPIVFLAIDDRVSELARSSTAGEDEFKLLFCGTGSPNRTPDRGQPCTALLAEGRLFLFDAGEGSIAKLAEYDAPLGRLRKIFLTHLHSDHVSGVAEVIHNTWLYGRRHAIEVVGPPGTRAMMAAFAEAYRQDLDERTRVLGAENIDPSMAFGEARDVRVGPEEMKTLHDADGLLVKAFQVDHPDWPYAYGYRIEHRGKSIVISGDTRPSDNLVRHAAGADLLVHEALNLEAMTRVGEAMDRSNGPIPGSRMARIAGAHTTTLDLARIAERAGVEELVLTHLIPALPSLWMAEQFFTSGMAEIYGGGIRVARDGTWIDLSE